jgi:SAM-dependent methyltransferase
MAIELVDRLDHDFADATRGVRLHAARVATFDAAVRRFLSQHPAGTVVALGEGLETQFWRVDNGSLLVFDAVPEVMLDLARIGPGSRVLDVAAGAGEQTITIAQRVGPSGYVLATDLSSNILEFAASEAKRHDLTNVETKVMDGENLDVPEGSFDAVISRVGLIYFPDQQKALAGMKRALKSGGRVAAIVYSTPDKNTFFSTPVGIIRRRANLGPPLPGQPGPFSLGAPGVLEAAFAQAGFRDIETRVVPAPLQMATSDECVRFEQESFGALHQMLSTKPDGQVDARSLRGAQSEYPFTRDHIYNK